MLNFHFKSRFSVKPSKFQIYFAKDCSVQYTYILSVKDLKMQNKLLPPITFKIGQLSTLGNFKVIE